MCVISKQCYIFNERKPMLCTMGPTHDPMQTSFCIDIHHSITTNGNVFPNLSHRAHGNPFGWTMEVFKLFPIDMSRNINNLMATDIWNVCIFYIHGHIMLTTFRYYIVDMIYMRKEYIFLHNKGISIIHITCAKTYYTCIMVGITLLRLLNLHEWCNDVVRK